MKRQTNTSDVLARALRERMKVAPIEKISVKSITDLCGLNRQTFYYHFHDIYELVRWMYLRDIENAIKESFKQPTWEESLSYFLDAIEIDNPCHQALYKSSAYYNGLRNDFYEMSSSMLKPFMEKKLPGLAHLEEGYRTFLVRMYVLVLFEFIEKRARGIAISTDKSFIRNWTRCLEEQRIGMDALIRA